MLPREFVAYLGHKEAVARLPDGAVLLASTATCPVHAFRIGRNVYATQFHPELDAARSATAIDAYSAHGYYEPHEQEAAQGRRPRGDGDRAGAAAGAVRGAVRADLRSLVRHGYARRVTTAEHVDVLIIGAGLSGIGAAAHLAKDLPATSYAVLERREVSGGTWDLFRYPGVRSDSDMHTLGYRFRPWRGDTALADGPRSSTTSATRRASTAWTATSATATASSRPTGTRATARWTVTSEVGGERRTMTADFLWACSGYYDYDAGYTPHFEGQERFGGQVVHPQHWPDDLDPTGKRVVVIGSRRDRRHARARPRRGRRRARHDAAALTDVRPLGAGAATR